MSSATQILSRSAATEARPAGYEELASRFPRNFDRITENARQKETERQLPFEEMEWLHESEITAATLPVEYGGGGASLIELFRLLVELGEADSNIPRIVPHTHRAPWRTTDAQRGGALQRQHHLCLLDLGGGPRRGRRAGLEASRNPVIYQARAVGREILEGDGLVYAWNTEEGRRYSSDDSK